MDFYKFCKILENVKNEWDPNEPDEGPDPPEYPNTCGQVHFQALLGFKNGAFYDLKNNKSWPPISFPKLQEVIGDAQDTYTLTSEISACSDYDPGYDYGGGDAKGVELVGEPTFDVEYFEIKNNKTKKSVEDIPVEFIQDKIIGINNTVYKIECDYGRSVPGQWGARKLDVWIS